MCSFSTQCRSAFSFWGRQVALGGLLCVILDSFVQQPVPGSLVQEAVKMVTSPSHWLMQHTYCTLHLHTSSVSAGASDLRVWQTPVATNTHTELPTVTFWPYFDTVTLKMYRNTVCKKKIRQKTCQRLRLSKVQSIS